MTDGTRPELLFAYGTLQDEAIQLAKLHRRLMGKPAVLPGHTLSAVRIIDDAVISTSGRRHHPIAWFTGRMEDKVCGTVFRLTPDELSQCDEYETPDYQRVRVGLESGESAWAYVRSPRSARPATFILVHGAWAGGWAWARVAERLLARGHRVHTPTLSGLGERSHLRAESIDLTTHITDVVNEVLWKNLERIVLVGHSYAGFVIAGVAEKIADRIQSIVFVDAFIPDDGAAFADLASWINATGPTVAAPPSAEGDYRSPEDRIWVDSKATPQPTGTFLEPLAVAGAYQHVPTKAFVQATGWDGPFDEAYAAAEQDPGWSAWQVDCGHDIPIDAPEELASILEACS